MSTKKQPAVPPYELEYEEAYIYEYNDKGDIIEVKKSNGSFIELVQPVDVGC